MAGRLPHPLARSQAALSAGTTSIQINYGLLPPRPARLALLKSPPSPPSLPPSASKPFLSPPRAVAHHESPDSCCFLSSPPRGDARDATPLHSAAPRIHHLPAPPTSLAAPSPKTESFQHGATEATRADKAVARARRPREGHPWSLRHRRARRRLPPPSRGQDPRRHIPLSLLHSSLVSRYTVL